MLRSVLRMLRTPFLMLRTLFQCCEHFFHVAPPHSSPDIVYMLRVMLRVCGEHVTSLWRACCDQHPNIVLRTLFPCCEQLFPCCAPFLLPRHSVHIASDVTSLWRACCELVASMLRSPSKHQMQGWWAVGRASDFFPRPTSDQEHYPFFSDRGVEPGAVSYRVLASLLAWRVHVKHTVYRNTETS
jgi:hypothetical protein